MLPDDPTPLSVDDFKHIADRCDALVAAEPTKIPQVASAYADLLERAGRRDDAIAAQKVALARFNAWRAANPADATKPENAKYLAELQAKLDALSAKAG